MIVTGYLLIFIYGFFLIFVLGNILRRKYEIEISRKIIHILLVGMWLIVDIFLKNTIHQIIVPLLFLFVNILSYRYKIFKAIEREKDNHMGTIYFALAITIMLGIAYCEPTLYQHVGIAVVCLTFGDGFAGIIGYKYGTAKIRRNKSIEGTVGGFLFSVIGCMLLHFISAFELKWYDILLLGLVVAIVELVDLGLDNLLIPFIAFVMSYGLVECRSNEMYIGLVGAVVIFCVVFGLKAIDYYGSLISMVIVFCFTYYGKILGLVYLLFTYFIIFAIALYKKKIKRVSMIERKTEEKYGKSAIQIIANGGIGTVFVILYGIVKEPVLLAISLICIGGCFVDSISSDVGVLSTKKPYDFVKRKYVDKGLSGGVSALGLITAAICSATLGFFIVYISGIPRRLWGLVALIIFAQTLIDSFLGSLIQVKKYCTKCGKIIESVWHCEQTTEYYSGISFVDNNMVNIISSVITCIISVITLLGFL